MLLDGFHTIRQSDRLHGAAVIERPVANLLQCGGDRKLPQGAETVESTLTDHLQPRGQLHGIDAVTGEIAGFMLHDGGNGFAVDLIGNQERVILHGIA